MLHHRSHHCIPSFLTARRISLLWVLGFITFYGLMLGGIFGLEEVITEHSGGLELTLFIFISVVLLGFSLSIVLALARQSDMLVIKRFAVFSST